MFLRHPPKIKHSNCCLTVSLIFRWYSFQVFSRDLLKIHVSSLAQQHAVLCFRLASAAGKRSKRLVLANGDLYNLLITDGYVSPIHATILSNNPKYLLSLHIIKDVYKIKY